MTKSPPKSSGRLYHRQSDLDKIGNCRQPQTILKSEGNFSDFRIHIISADDIICDADYQALRPLDIAALADSIRKYGILQPLTVCSAGEVEGKFLLISGRRRLYAAIMLNIFNLPCIILNAGKNGGRKSAEIAMIEKIHREESHFFEQAESIADMISRYRLTQEETASCLSVSQSYIANKLRLLKFTRGEREQIVKTALSERHARSLLRLPENMRGEAISAVAADGMSVARTEEYVDSLLCGANPARRFAIADLRLFYNSIDRAVNLIKSAGANVTLTRLDSANATVLTITVGTGNRRDTTYK